MLRAKVGVFAEMRLSFCGSLGLTHTAAIPLGWLLVVGNSLHIPDKTLFFAKFFESSHHLLHGFAGA